MVLPAGTEERWQLYRLLGEPVRLRLLALAAEEELGVGELAELLGEAQPNVSRHAGALRQAGLLLFRREGTRSWVRLEPGGSGDPVVLDALRAGRQLCQQDGSLARVAEIIAGRDRDTREFFARPGALPVDRALSPAVPAYLLAIGAALVTGGERRLAIDIGTGDGALLDLLAPLFAQVVAVDRSSTQLARARARVAARRYTNVTFLEDDLGSAHWQSHASAGADLVVSSRVLHHAPRPREMVRDLAALMAAAGALLVIDYAPHEDEQFAREQADVWLGFSPEELTTFALEAGLVARRVLSLPRGHLGQGRDVHLAWQAMVAHKPAVT
jgi:DNA-binding transcriptional ArsR family regulator